MTLDQLQQRDRRVAELEAIPARLRTRERQDELGRLWSGIDHFLRRLPAALDRARRRTAELEAYARQQRLPL